MTIKRVAQEILDLSSLNGTVFYSSQAPSLPGGTFDDNATRGSFVVNGNSTNNFFDIDIPTPGQEIWTAFTIWKTSGSFSTSGNMIRFLNQSNVVRYQIRPAATTTLRLDRGTTQIATILATYFWNNDRRRFVVYIKSNTAGQTDGIFRVWIDNILVAEFLGDLATTDFIHRIRFSWVMPLDGTAFSEIIVADEDLRDTRLLTKLPLSFGTYQEWDGNIPSIIEVVDDPNTFMSTEDKNKTITFTTTQTPISLQYFNLNYEPHSYVISSLSQKTTTSPGNLAPYLIFNTDEYEDPNLYNLSETLSNYFSIYEQNPYTQTPWAITDFDNIQIGLKTK
jgi:hypothetical protein